VFLDYPNLIIIGRMMLSIYKLSLYVYLEGTLRRLLTFSCDCLFNFKLNLKL